MLFTFFFISKFSIEAMYVCMYFWAIYVVLTLCLVCRIYLESVTHFVACVEVFNVYLLYFPSRVNIRTIFSNKRREKGAWIGLD